MGAEEAKLPMILYLKQQSLVGSKTKRVLLEIPAKA